MWIDLTYLLIGLTGVGKGITADALRSVFDNAIFSGVMIEYGR